MSLLFVFQILSFCLTDFVSSMAYVMLSPEEKELLSPDYQAEFTKVVTITASKNIAMRSQNEKIPIRHILLQRLHFCALQRHLQLLMELEAKQQQHIVDHSSSSSSITTTDEFDFTNFDPDCELIV